MTKFFTSTVSVLTLGLFVASAAEITDFSKLDLSKLPLPAARTDVTYEKDIRPLLEASCFRCHGEQRPKGELRLDKLEAVLKGGKDGKVVVPGDSKNSLLVVAVAQLDPESAMPPKRGPGRGPGGGGPGPDGTRPPPPGVPEAGSNATNAPGFGRGPRGPAGFGGPGGPGGPGGFGPPPKPLTAEQVGLLRAWIDQGAK